MQVKVTRTTHHFKQNTRTVSTEVLTLDPDKLPGVSLNAGIAVEWPSGHIEHAFPTTAFPGYAPTFIPANGRLARIFKEHPCKSLS